MLGVLACAEGIPEPGLVLYGSVTNTAGGFGLMSVGVLWTAAGAGSSLAVGSTIANVNGQYFYIAQIPFETRAVSGRVFEPRPNTLPLTDTTTQFSRSASVLGTRATLAPPALPVFNFGKGDRGRVERVDILVHLPSVLPPTNSPPANLDTDGDGVPDWAEQLAGANPTDPHSVFRVSTDIQPIPGGGLIIKWSSVAGKTYSIHRSADLGQLFVPIATNLRATAPENRFEDPTAVGFGPYFYRISVD
ncbi:MAG: hypothetical protein FJ387_28540 [Verrucomicrobia bacterium]|nr:hypothetical protein [Verrucomicrobiota bacterium]